MLYFIGGIFVGIICTVVSICVGNICTDEDHMPDIQDVDPRRGGF